MAHSTILVREGVSSSIAAFCFRTGLHGWSLLVREVVSSIKSCPQALPRFAFALVERLVVKWWCLFTAFRWLFTVSECLFTVPVSESVVEYPQVSIACG